MGQTIKDVTGEVWGNLVITENLPSKKFGSRKMKRVKAKCGCGVEKDFTYRDLKRGDTKSCGCMNAENKVDIIKHSTYNYWTILKEVPKYVDKKGNKSRKVLAECVCGKQKEIILNSLRTGASKSCGCMTEHGWKEESKGKRLTIDSPIQKIDIEKINQRDMGYWVILEEISAKRNEKAEIIRTVIAECKCGHRKTTTLDSMRGSKQCFNCYINGLNKKISPEERNINKKLSGVYKSIKNRCYNPKCKDYTSYGKKEITMCEEWKNSATLFYKWALDNGYKVGLEIDRQNNSLGYCPENCRWVTKEVNLLNMSAINLTLEDVKFIRSLDFDINTMADNYTCSIEVIKRIMNYETFKNI